VILVFEKSSRKKTDICLPRSAEERNRIPLAAKTLCGQRISGKSADAAFASLYAGHR